MKIAGLTRSICCSVALLLVAGCTQSEVKNDSALPGTQGTTTGASSQPVVTGTALNLTNLEPVESTIGGLENAPSTTASVVTSSNSGGGGTYLTPLNLTGGWRSEKVEPSGNGRYAIREYVFMGNRWTSTYTLYADKNQRRTLFTLKAKGMFTVQNPSARIPGAYLIAFRNLEKYLRLENMEKPVQKELGFEYCNMKPGLEEDISSKGCGIAMRVTECPNDYDLIRQELKDGRQTLTLGNRFAEMSSCAEDKRPVALGLPLLKTGP